MMLRKPLTSALYLCVITLLIAFPKESEMVRSHADSPRDDSIVEITLKTDKTEAVPGEAVCLHELIPAAMNVEVRGMGHRILRIGYFNERLGKLVNIDKSSLFEAVDLDKDFKDLPGSLGFSHPYEFEIKTPRFKGAEFTFRPKRLGIYLINSSWLLSDKGGYISSTPVILIVKPPLDAQGKAIVKPEWVNGGKRR